MGLYKEKDERDGYVYDAAVKGGDTTFWSEVLGSIATDTTGVNKTIRVSSARLHSFLQHKFGEYEFMLEVPASPGAATNQSWGLRTPKNDTSDSLADTGIKGGGIYFQIDTNATFQAISYDDFGNRESTTLTFDSDAYDGVQNRYQIRWEADQVKFLINDTVVATHTTRVPQSPQPLELKNYTASNLDIAYIRVASAGAII